jgi:SAM-dependent methyltransferase
MVKKNVRQESEYWNQFYKDWTLDVPSQFCVLAATEIESGSVVVEFGCGNGRDALYLAEHKYRVVAMDLSQEAIRKDKLIASERKGNSLTFLKGDVSNDDDVKRAVAISREGKIDQKISVYTRFFLHTLDSSQEIKFIKALSRYLQSGDKLFFEFRSKEDERNTKIYEDHYRRFIDTEKFVLMLQRQFNFKLLYCITGRGMAKFKLEDPIVSRVILKK